MRALPSSFAKSIVFLICFTLAAVVGTTLFTQPAAAQEQPQLLVTTPRPLITEALDESRLTVLKGNTHPLARREFDLGTAPASLPMERMLLVLKRSDAQETALRKLLDDQQDKNSPNYHRWLTPEQFGAQYGPTDADIQTITSWLQSHGFQVGSTKGRSVLEFSGSASQVQEAFHTSIHKYVVKGEQRWANASDPQIPAALGPAVAGIASLHNFPRKVMNNFVGTYSEETKRLTSANPNFTFSCGNQSCYGLVPYDFAAIYDLLPLWNAGVNGAGQTIAIVGRTNINQVDPITFWSLFGLSVPQNKLTVTLNGPDPGINGDEGEADIDIQWSGAVAPQALINFVTSQSTNTTDGVDLSAVYIVENNLAPVMSESYGECELGLGTAGNQFFSTIWAQAAAQGISVFVSSGDNGSAGCDDPSGPAQYGLNVNGIASTPFNAAVGGTDFNQYNKWSTYWNSSNNATTQQSAKGYIPETTWNDSCTNALAVTLGYGSNAERACNNPQMIANGGVNSVAGSGGPSNCVVNTQGVVGSCTKGYAKPTWQTGTGTQTDQLRDLPDISLFASNGFLGSFYVVCQQDQTGPCTLNSFVGYGGTSVASPALAGIMALVNQKMGSSQGVPGFALYKLVSKQANAFHDIPTGSTIAPPCNTGSPNCKTNTSGDIYGVLTGYSTATGYDLATGLGSVDAANLVNNWNKATFTATTSTLTLNNGNPVNATHGTAVPINIAISPAAATGNAALLVDVGPGTTTGKAIDFFTLSGGSVSGTTSLLPAGTYNVIAHYGGDTTYGGSYSNSLSVTVSKEASTLYLPGLQLGGASVTTVKYDDPYTLLAAVENANGKTCNPPPYGKIVCPTGTISLSDGAASLGSGPYTLDSTASIQTPTAAFVLPTGAHTLTAQYSGDANYNTGAASVAITVTQAATLIAAPSVYNATVGQSASINVYVNTTSYGVAPTGTITLYANGKLLNGTSSYNSFNGGAGFYASFSLWFNTTANSFPTPGNYAITASYSGDANYTSSTSAATNLNVMYPTPSVLVTPSSQTVSYGSTATVAALIGTTNKSKYPTGTVTFQDAYTGATLAGPTSCTNATDTSGYFACQASGSFTVTSGDPVNVQYSGDANYPSSSTWAFINMPDFYLNNPGVITLTAGQSQSVTIGVGSLNGFDGSVSSFSCSGLPAETTCTFTPTQVTASQNASNTTTLTVTTAAIGQSRRGSLTGVRSMNWTITGSTLLLGVCFLGIPLSRRRGRIPTALALIALLILLPSCGGGGNSGGGGGGTLNPVPHIISLNPSQVAAGSQIGIITVDGSNFLANSTVTLGGVAASGYMPSSNQIVIYPSTNQLATVAQLPVVVTNPAPGGGPSSPVNFVVTTGTPTGSFSVTFTASSGPLTHSQTFTMVVQ
jgi:Pro-kumamolisin, activation domain/Bacterial Ig-like domain (group 3)